jgi:Spy/CpxP family protein refolding chaperone
MKSTIQRVLFAVAVATLGAGAVGTAAAQTASSAPTSAPPGHHGHHGHFRGFGGGRFVGTLLRATKQLNLTADQQANIKNILKSARSNFRPGTHGSQPGITVLGNPAHPDFAGAVQSAQAAASGRIQKESALAGQIYAQLTTTQQQQLPAVLAAIQAQQQARRAQWAARRANGNG